MLRHGRERRTDRFAHGQEFLRKQGGDPVFAADDRILETLGQRLRDVVAQRRDEMNPIRTQARCEHWHRENPPRPESQLFGHHPHEVAIAQHVGATHIEYAASHGRLGQRCDQIADDIAHRNGLARRAHPSRRAHEGQAFDEITQNLEGCRAGPDDHGGP